MLYEALTPKRERLDNILKTIKFLLMATTAFSSALTLFYIQQLATGLEKADLNEVKEIFEQLRECVIESHICS